jgi:hypothetical protein
MRNILLTGLMVSVLGASPSVAEVPMVLNDFSAKRIGVPKPGQKRLNIQIDPEEQAAALKPKPRVPVIDLPPVGDSSPETTIGTYSWFWDRISPSMAQSGPGRLQVAMDVITGAGKIPQPRMQHMQSIAKANGVDILKSTIGTRVSPALVLAVISVESAGKTNAVSHAGAQGLMQLMPATAERFGVKNSLAPTENISGGVKYLDWLMQEFNGDPIMVLAGYNAGEGSVRKYAGVPPFAETRDYVPKVLAAFQVARGLCRTPPELVTDGCVFAALN